jgi:hypothetical protein
MKQKTEIFSIRFAHVRIATDILSTTYTIGTPFLSGGRLVTPLKIVMSEDKKHITTFFDDDSSHILWYTEDVEIFKRKIDGKKIQDEVK